MTRVGVRFTFGEVEEPQVLRLRCAPLRMTRVGVRFTFGEVEEPQVLRLRYAPLRMTRFMGQVQDDRG
jgi:hypothetical protein